MIYSMEKMVNLGKTSMELAVELEGMERGTMVVQVVHRLATLMLQVMVTVAHLQEEAAVDQERVKMAQHFKVVTVREVKW